jgi:hypothetical protein
MAHKGANAWGHPPSIGRAARETYSAADYCVVVLNGDKLVGWIERAVMRSTSFDRRLG